VSATTLSRNQHVALLVLMGAMLVGILLAAGIYLSEFWFWVVWAVLGLGGWSNRYYNQRKTPGWALVPSAIFGAAAMIYYFDKLISEA
jgi:hypothetical protein